MTEKEWSELENAQDVSAFCHKCLKWEGHQSWGCPNKPVSQEDSDRARSICTRKSYSRYARPGGQGQGQERQGQGGQPPVINSRMFHIDEDMRDDTPLDADISTGDYCSRMVKLVSSDEDEIEGTRMPLPTSNYEDFRTLLNSRAAEAKRKAATVETTTDSDAPPRKRDEPKGREIIRIPREFLKPMAPSQAKGHEQ
ncbi:hypothetical protein SAICODRAFT_9352 [Saitoella complicata NRRL Y-17804]|uniref:uncharacterized protein n=1 Tax=Saitoella complicata (strain BCRC 22490 / CBS 7301 / JCM 7358 / NBRC 10748 / NRRL Y-17804) TaxID=698492 RepID=UPI000867993C|nr:uncharacterized protein SAICODRAFT_9352 [Saitoella complicata NRRL Y-17804]ODQ51025.1 hypothetical protein SAICODRAFT_9352 [Saitoella complicata NRRL Y-17804]